jgi:hypothetical protein
VIKVQASSVSDGPLGETNRTAARTVAAAESGRLGDDAGKSDCLILPMKRGNGQDPAEGRGQQGDVALGGYMAARRG